MINGQIKLDMLEFIAGCGGAPGMGIAAGCTLAEWSKSSGWSKDTGGERDASGAPVRAQDGVLKELWDQVYTAEREKASLEMMFPGLCMGHQEALPVGGTGQAGCSAGAGGSDGGEWQGVLDQLASGIQADLDREPTNPRGPAAESAFPPSEPLAGDRAGGGGGGLRGLGLGAHRLWAGAKSTSELAAAVGCAVGITVGSTAASIGQSAAAVSQTAVNAAAAAAAELAAGGPTRYSLTINPGELLPEVKTIVVIPRQLTLEGLIDGIRDALLPLQPHHQARKRLEGAPLALTINTYIVTKFSDVPAVATVDVHRAETLGWSGPLPPTEL